MREVRTIILAAGKGTRIKSSFAKVLHLLAGRPLLQYVLDIANFLGSLKIIVVIGHHHEAVAEYLKASGGPSTSTVLQKKLLGTADAVRIALRQLKNFGGDVVILCGDTPLLSKETVRSLLRRHQALQAACTFLTAIVKEPLGYGRVIRHSGRVTAIREEKDATEAEKNIAEINAGVYCFRAADLRRSIKAVKVNHRKKEFYLTDVIELLAKEHAAVETITLEDELEGLGINTREDLAVAEEVLRQRILKKWMREGVTIVDPKTTYIEADVKIGQDTTIRPFTVIEGNVRIGRRCMIGPFARLRPGTKIADAAEVGNFAEVSRTHVGKQTLMKHFGFLGDARVGAKVNIGAGVVTANYDGKEKNVTQIADGAFVGSDSILIAPVKIGRKALTAAGCVITKKTVVPNQAVAVGVPARIIKRGKSL